MSTTHHRKFTIVYTRGINGVEINAQCFYCKVLLDEQDTKAHTLEDCNFNTHYIDEGDDFSVWCTECKMTDYIALTETACEARF